MKLTPNNVALSIIAVPFALTNWLFIVALPISIVEAVQNPKTASNVSVTPSVIPSVSPSVTPRKPIKSYADEYAPEYKAPTQVDDDQALKYALEAKKALELAKEDAELAEIEAAMMSTPEAKADLKLQKARAEAFDAMIEQDQKDNPERWVNSTPYVKSADRYKNR